MSLMRDYEKLTLLRKHVQLDGLDLTNDKVFSDVTGISYKTIRSWREKGHEYKGNLHQNTKSKIASALKLKYDVWEDEFATYDDDILLEKLDEYKEISVAAEPQSASLDELVLGSLNRMTDEEEDLLAEFAGGSTVAVPNKLENYTAEFMLALARELKNVNRIHDALSVLDILEHTSRGFKYIYRKQITHLRAILLSHRAVQKWDDAIDLLRYLYADAYHLDDPEIITLLASNHKRKALYQPDGQLHEPDQIDLERLANAKTLYREAFGRKPHEAKYYDAINIAYLEVMLDKLGEGESGLDVTHELEALYETVYQKGWSIDHNNWWEVASQMEFALLLGKDSDAEALLESLPTFPTQFEVDATTRQIELYAHFVPDERIDAFLTFLRAKVTTH